jgi:hypothetical protein
MDEALDQVAKTFNGIVMYGACTDQPLYVVYFTGGTSFDMPEPPPQPMAPSRKRFSTPMSSTPP